MRNAPLLTGMVLLLCFGPDADAQTEYEPCWVFEVEESMTMPGQPPSSQKQTCFTAAELPWTPPGIEQSEGLQGFVRSREVVQVPFQDKTVAAERITWTRDPKQGHANISAASATFWVSKEVPTPSFQLPGSGPDLPVPAGCVKLEVVPHQGATPGIDDFEVESTIAATGELKPATTYELPNSKLEAYTFDFSIRGEESMTGSATLSPKIPGGVCCMQMTQGQRTGAMRIIAMDLAPAIQGAHAFPGFAYAPPTGYARTPEPPTGEIVRYVKAHGSYISVTQVQLGQDGLAGLYELGLSRHADSEDMIFSSGRDHVAGHNTFRVSYLKVNVGCIFAEHNGHGYKIAISNLDDMPPAEVSTLLRGWRWKKP